MILGNLLDKIENGSAKVFIYDSNGEKILKTIWYNTIPQEIMKAEVESICVLDYELRIGVKL